jgi:hypothetical protein
MGYDTGVARGGSAGPVDLSAQPSLPPGLFKAARAGECTYTFFMKPTAGGYTIELVFA